MLCELLLMQISGSNLLVAAQQQARQAPESSSKAFAAALKEAAGPAKFAPMSLDEIAGPDAASKPQAAAAPKAQQSAKPAQGILPPGSQLDIRV